ncbi:MAG: riboflavin synthase [Opitutaceae bacterium]|nr:riboflavin synthase [Opitutaceae bacterium]
MFTGIVEETGRILEFTAGRTGWRLRIHARVALEGLTLGDSVAVNGCCLTAVACDAAAGVVEFDVLEETRRLTNLGSLASGDAINLERSLAFGGKMGGHFVTGHIDGTGRIEQFQQRGADHYLRIAVPIGFGRYLIPKGSIAIDGMSLTVAEVDGDAFSVWIIPHTLEVTNLKGRKPGDSVNLEFDLLGKYVEKLLAPRFSGHPGE